jgi:hypothetical protein
MDYNIEGDNIQCFFVIFVPNVIQVCQFTLIYILFTISMIKLKMILYGNLKGDKINEIL